MSNLEKYQFLYSNVPINQEIKTTCASKLLMKHRPCSIIPEMFMKVRVHRRRDFWLTETGEECHNVSVDTDRCFDVIKATNSEVYPQARWLSVSERFLSHDDRQLLMDRYRCVQEVTGTFPITRIDSQRAA